MTQFHIPELRMVLLALLFFFVSPFIHAQVSKIQGRVIDASTKVPLAGVSVAVKNTSTGTSTDPDGNFTLEVPQNGRILVSFVGYLPIEVGSSQRNPTIQLSASAQQLNEVVVTATGIKKESKRLGYAIQSI